jgi:hypothetical protein
MPHTQLRYDLRRAILFAWTHGILPLGFAPLLIWFGSRIALDFWYLYQRAQSTVREIALSAPYR